MRVVQTISFKILGIAMSKGDTEKWGALPDEEAPKSVKKEEQPIEQTLLVIAADERLREALSHGAKKGTEVLLAGSLAQARSILNKHTPDLILSNLLLPDTSGLELFKTLTQYDIPTSFMSNCLIRFRSTIGKGIHSKNNENLNKLINQCECPNRERDRPKALSLADCIPLAALSNNPVRIELVRQNQVEGFVNMSQGELRFCSDGSGSGRLALGRLLRRPHVLVTCRAAKDIDTSRGDLQNWQKILLEEAPAHWRDDLSGKTQEGLANKTSTPSSTSLPEKNEDPYFNELLDRGLDALLEKRFDEASKAFNEAQRLQPENSLVKANLQRLSTMEVELGLDLSKHKVDNE